MSQDDTPASHAGKSAADLIASGRMKYALAQARLHQRQRELALLSITGCLEDVFRGYLLLYNNPVATADWATLLASLRSRSEPSLSVEEVARLNRMQRLRTFIIQGESVTVTEETMLTYQQFAAALMVRYGVVVVAPESSWHGMPSEQRMVSHTIKKPIRLHRSFIRLLPALLITLIFVIGAGATLAFQQSRAIPETVLPPPSSVTTTAVPGSLAVNGMPTDTRTGGVSPGQTVYVRTDMAEGLPLREQPGIASSIPIRLYLSVGTAVEVLDGPVRMDGAVWWKVSAANQEGWCAEEFLVVR